MKDTISAGVEKPLDIGIVELYKKQTSRSAALNDTGLYRYSLKTKRFKDAPRRKWLGHFKDHNKKGAQKND